MAPTEPDLNPIEHLWEEVKRRRRGQHATNKAGLQKLIQETWDGLGPEVCQKLVDSMPARCEAVIKARGGPTKY